MITVKEMLYEWLQVYVKPCRATNTYLCYQGTIERILKQAPEYRTKPITDIQEIEIQKLLNTLSLVYSKSTLRKVRTVFHEAFDAAVRNNDCSRNPINCLTIPKRASEKKVRALTYAEQKQVESAAIKDPLGHIVIFLLYTGLRASELCNLQWKDYDQSGEKIHINMSKTSAGIRAIPLLPIAKKIIEQRPHFCDYIFTSTIKKPVTKTVLQKLSYRMRRATGINWITTHVYRHSFATRLVEKGVNYKALAALLGHTDIAFTLQRYTDAEEDFLRKQIFLLDKK
jgi:integrase